MAGWIASGAKSPVSFKEELERMTTILDSINGGMTIEEYHAFRREHRARAKPKKVTLKVFQEACTTCRYSERRAGDLLACASPGTKNEFCSNVHKFEFDGGPCTK